MQMFETPLLSPTDLNQKVIYADGVKALVTDYGASNFEVLLEINSNKILVSLQGAFDAIEKFEVIAVKGFVELSKSFITMIKKLIGHLLYRID